MELSRFYSNFLGKWAIHVHLKPIKQIVDERFYLPSVVEIFLWSGIFRLVKPTEGWNEWLAPWFCHNFAELHILLVAKLYQLFERVGKRDSDAAKVCVGVNELSCMLSLNNYSWLYGISLAFFLIRFLYLYFLLHIISLGVLVCNYKSSNLRLCLDFLIFR